MAKFSFLDIMNTQSKAMAAGSTDTYTEIYLSPYDVKPSENNFYSQNNIEELADSFLAVGQQQPTVLGRINREFRIISGHRRNLANILNLERGYEEYRNVRFLYRDMSEAIFELSLLVGNAFNRELTDYEKTEQAARLKKALIRAKEEDGLEIPGKLRNVIADLLNESSTNIARMEQITNNAAEEVKEEFKKGSIGITAAYEASKLPQEEQKQIAKQVSEGQDIRAKEIAMRVAEKNATKAADKAEKAKLEADQKAYEAEKAAENAKTLRDYVNESTKQISETPLNAQLESETDTEKIEKIIEKLKAVSFITETAEEYKPGEFKDRETVVIELDDAIKILRGEQDG